MDRATEDQIHAVVVGVDGGTESADVLTRALGIAAGRRAPVSVVRAWELPATSCDAASPRWHSSLGAVIDADTRRLVATAQTSLPDPVPVRVRVVEGPAGPVLVELSAQALLLVVGPPADGLRHDAGSTAWYVLTHARCPVEVLGVTPEERAGLTSASA